MAYLGIALVVLIIVAPILALLPSARQKEQMALRKGARSAGLRTDLTTIDDPNPDQERYKTITGKALEPKMKCIAYRLPRARPSEWRSLPEVTWAVARTGEKAWTWIQPLPPGLSDELRQTIDAALEKLPADAIRVDEERYMISVYWSERGGTEALDSIVEALKSLAAVTPHAPRPDDDSDDSR